MEELYLAALNTGIGGCVQGEDNWDDGHDSYRGFNKEDEKYASDEEQEARAKRLNRKRRLAKKRKAEARWAA